MLETVAEGEEKVGGNMKNKIVEDAVNSLQKRRFLNIATCDFDGRPNVAPKLLLKIENNNIYLVDYVRNTTLKNLKVNPNVSISFINTDTITGFQINGGVELIEQGAVYELLLSEYKQMQIDYSTERLIKSLHDNKKRNVFEAEFPEKVAILKIKINETVRINLQGHLEREGLSGQRS